MKSNHWAKWYRPVHCNAIKIIASSDTFLPDGWYDTLICISPLFLSSDTDKAELD